MPIVRFKAPAWGYQSALAAVLMLLLTTACRDEPRRPVASPSVAQTTAPAAAPVASTTMVWDSALGPAMLLAMDASPDSVGVVGPSAVEGTAHDAVSTDTGAPVLSHAKLDLFGRSGIMGTAVVRGVPVSHAARGCTAWPRARIDGGAAGWRVALVAGHASGLPLDSLRGFAADSSRLAATLTALAATASSARDTTFAGVPFVVRSMYRFRVDGGEALAASLRRGIPSEADPREEQTFLIAERSASDSTYHVSFTRRTLGTDEPAQVTDILAALQLRVSHHSAIVLSEEHENGGSVGLVERVAPGQWRETWRSSYVGC